MAGFASMLYAHILFCCHIATFPYNCIHSYITTEPHNHIATQPQRIPARKAIALEPERPLRGSQKGHCELEPERPLRIGARKAIAR